MPFVTGKPFQGRIGQEQNQNDNDQNVDQKISKKQYHDRISRSFHRDLGKKKAADTASIVVEFG